MEREIQTTASEQLCERCADAKVAKFLPTQNGRAQLEHGTIQEILNRRECVFCRLLSQALQQCWREVPLEEQRRYNDTKVQTSCRLVKVQGIDLLRTDEDDVRGAIAVEIYNGNFKLMPKFNDACEAELRPLAVGDSPLLGAARIVKPFCDFDLIQTWFARCQKSHPVPTTGPHRAPNLRVIDVTTMCVIPAPENCRYVALSYVWGTDAVCLEAKVANYRQLEVESGLRQEHLPPTIQDAIQVTRTLGESYLWVDRLCIIQDGPHKGEQIEHMVDIYREASFTIVAAAGNSASACLPGVGTARTPQQKATIHGVELVVSTPGLPWFLDQSKWKSRAWTYQEWQFSKRALVFTPHETVFVCECGPRCESIVSEIETGPEIKPDLKPLGQITLVGRRGEADLRRHMEDNATVGREHVSDWLYFIQNYSKRQMTYGTDALNALKSTAIDFTQNSGIGIVAGLPETDLHVALMWRPHVSMKRREDVIAGKGMFPTWSWCGWEGEIEYEQGRFTTDNTVSLRFNFFFFTRRPNPTLRFLPGGRTTIPGAGRQGPGAGEASDDLERLEAEFGQRLSFESYGGMESGVQYKRHQAEEVKYNKIMNWVAISTAEALMGRMPTNSAEIALAQELVAYQDLDGSLSEENLGYLTGRASTHYTPVVQVQDMQELCEGQIASLRSRFRDVQSISASPPTRSMPEIGYLVFQTSHAFFYVRNNLKDESAYDRDVYPYGVYSRLGYRVGEVTLQSKDQSPPEQAEFIAICKQHPEQQLRFAPRDPTDVPGEQWGIMNDVKYGVLMIERDKYGTGIAYRIGQGTISVRWWDAEMLGKKLIVLG